MIYRDRKYLSILTLTEDRDYVTYDELIYILEERPSGRVYVERDGILCGLLTAGRIERRHDGKTHRVPFNKNFTSVHPEEYSRTWKILEKMNEVPVVSEDGRLLGEHTRWNDSTGTDYAELLLKDPYVLQGLKADIHNTVFVKPTVHEGTNRAEMFSWWRQKLESKGIHLQVIQQREINDYLNVAKYFLFVDGDEKIGIEVLNQYLYRNKTTEDISFCTIINYLYHMKQIASMRLNTSILEALQNQGVFVLLVDFKENSNEFFAILNKKLERRNEKYGVTPFCSWLQFPEELKKSFAGELYCEAYKIQKFPWPMSVHNKLGVPYFSDAESELFNIQNGERLTVNQPEEYDRCIYFFGACVIVGPYVPDQYTLPSLLQSKTNQAGFSCKVVNRGFWCGYLSIERLLSESFKRGDIVLLSDFGAQVESFPVVNLTDLLEENDAPTDWFVDNIRHCNHKANQVFAHAIYEELLPVLQRPSGERTPVEQDYDYIDHFYMRHYFSNFDHTKCGTIGSIVMNCNPFTFGHRFLIEEALTTVDFLIIFVVEEDESLFSFQERFAMVCQGTSDLKRIMVVPSGPYILSKNTFPEYFQKINDEDLKKNTEDDITLFAEKIAPKLGITYRFVGEEREDKVTNEYNEAMKRILPRYGIQVVEIPRKANGQSVISASRVRHCLSLNQMEKLDELIPASTKQILFYEVK